MPITTTMRRTLDVGERHRAPASALDGNLSRVVDGSLAGAILIVPWCMGGRHPIGELFLVAFALAASLAWIGRQWLSAGALGWNRSPADAIFPAAVLLVLIQLTPLPTSVFEVLSPHSPARLPLWMTGEGPAGLGIWNQVSMTPQATRTALVLLLAYGLLFLTGVQRIARLEDVERVLRWVALSVTLMAGFGLVQYLTDNGKFLWVYQHPFRYTGAAATGMYINKNHFAHLLALGVGPLVWCLARDFGAPKSELERLAQRVRPWRKAVVALGLAVVVFAGLMSLSRGGVAMIALAGAVSGAAMYRAGLLGWKSLGSMAGIVLLVGFSLAIHGHRQVTERLDDYAALSLEALDTDGGRRAIWQADAVALKDYFVFGSGVGSHREVYPMHLAEPFETEFTHAENGYLQIALECGIPGIALLLIALANIGAWCAGPLRDPRSQRLFACAAAVTASLLVSAVHSLVDFVWYVPSCMTIALVLAACAVRLWQLNRPDRAPAPWRLPRAAPLAACGLIAIAGAWIVRDRTVAAIAAPHWDAYLRFALTPEAKAGHVKPDLRVIEHLRQVTAWTPGDARAHLALAEACLQHFELVQALSANAMPLGQIRDAALASKFESREALDAWLARAIGENRQFLDLALWHTRRALASCPLQGQAYVYLAELCFLNGSNDMLKPALIDQALRVRPYSGSVLMSAGSEAALAEDLPRALEYWRRAFRTGPIAQRQFIEMWAQMQLPVEIILSEFDPDLPAVRLMQACYAARAQDEQVRTLLTFRARKCEQAAQAMLGAQAAPLWLELHNVYRELKRPQPAIEALRQAATLTPNDFATRHLLAVSLFEQRQFAESEQHLRWCLERRVEDQQLRELLANAVKGRIGGERVSASHDQVRWQ